MKIQPEGYRGVEKPWAGHLPSSFELALAECRQCTRQDANDRPLGGIMRKLRIFESISIDGYLTDLNGNIPTPPKPPARNANSMTGSQETPAAQATCRSDAKRIR
jgi:hypothetical protein